MMQNTPNAKFYKTMHVILRHTVIPVLKWMLGFKGEEITSPDGPMFILCNHNTDFDFLLLAGVSKEPMDYVATEAMTRMGPLADFAVKYLRPILHDKGSSGIETIRQIAGRIKAGRNVSLFPEGYRSFDGRTCEVSPAIGKIAAMTGASLVLYRIEGGYFTTPRWGRGIRKGRMRGKVIKRLTPAEVKKLSNAELLKVIKESLYTDAYQEQMESPVKYKSRNRAEYLETLLFSCPSCRKIGTLSSHRNKLTCSCGYEFKLDEYGFLSDGKGEKLSITGAFEDQKKYLKDLIASKEAGEMLWQDEISFAEVNKDHSVSNQLSCTLSAYPGYLSLGDTILDRELLGSIDVVQRNRLSIHVNGKSEHYELMGKETFNAVKYRLWSKISFPGKE